MIEINNRRYIGNKSKILPYIKKLVADCMQSDNYSFADLFAGTGVVAHSFATAGHPTIVNDILYSNIVAYNAWLSNAPYSVQKVGDLLSYFNTLSFENLENNYFSDVYGEKYFSVNNAKIIGFIRDYLENHRADLTEREYYIILTSLLYATDKIANTVGHFEYFLSKTPIDLPLILQPLDLCSVAETQIYNVDANILAKDINSDVIYIDPPYNARQYVNFYHVLENLARWNKPTEFEGNSMKFKRNELKSGYSRSNAPQLFESLVNDLHCRLIVVSYNNTYEAKSIASINKIKESEIIDILSTKGKVSEYFYDYKSFNAGKTDLNGHKEMLFTCEVGK